MKDSSELLPTQQAYDEVAQHYAELFATELDTKPFDRAMLAAFAESAGAGPVADLGCGPGRLTGHLHGLGLDVFGVDLSPEMIRLARVAHPTLRFEVGPMQRLAVADGSLGGIVAWYSIIHTPPQSLPEVFAEFGRVLRPGAPLLLGFFAADAPHDVQPYDHRVTPGFRWSARRIEELLRPCGIAAEARLIREPLPAERCPQIYLQARKSH
ncbi:class I SAM-dependent methyltransferase [Nocardia sp. alder85J]|uniref:class I SAM-dependent methyltransferase n=1 Tax=Nocardia sp. alder85J TaxID=2862949 RepID=UPI001CD1DFDA|nr:class I SAM-dependent methyltransferase [Nocardia sp. alder85J]MCX4096412.1 class I SAM-dependent methyltransferase [Nocardia sp. alder85J]